MKRLLEELFETYHKDVYTYLFSLCRDASLSEDLTSEVFLEVVKSIGLFRGEADIKTWLFSIARHRWYAYLRRQRKEPVWVAIQDLYDLADGQAELESVVDSVAERIREILAGESGLIRDVVQLRLDGYSYYEIGQKLEISENSARVVYFRAKMKIRKQLEKEGHCYE